MSLWQKLWAIEVIQTPPLQSLSGPLSLAWTERPPLHLKGWGHWSRHPCGHLGSEVTEDGWSRELGPGPSSDTSMDNALCSPRRSRRHSWPLPHSIPGLTVNQFSLRSVSLIHQLHCSKFKPLIISLSFMNNSESLILSSSISSLCWSGHWPT